MSNEEQQRRPPRIPTEPPPPPPARMPEHTIPDDGPDFEETPTPRAPEHAPSQNVAGRVQLKRRATPPDRAALIIDRQASATPRDRRHLARGQAGLCLSSAGTIDLTR